MANGPSNFWVSQNLIQISQVSQSHFVSGYEGLEVSLFIRSCLRVSSFFARLGVSHFVCLLVFISDVCLLLGIEFQ